MADRIRIGSASDFQEGRGRRVEIDDEQVAVFRSEGRLWAVQDACPHLGASLADRGLVLKGRLICGWHNYAFDLATGRGYQSDCLRTYPVEIDGDEVYLRRTADREVGAGQTDQDPDDDQ